ncbi:MAG: hypothetical protein R2752_18515 [Vicinamibacterales bacterium]
MSDRKYRQRGYQDSDRERRPQGPSRPQPPREPRDPRMPRDPRVPNMPGFRQVFRCARCGRIESTDILPLSRCGGCGVALRACIQCDSFDPGARFECRQDLTARVSPKDEPNECRLFAPRVQVERETGSTPSSGSSGGTSAAKKAFDDLFKF